MEDESQSLGVSRRQCPMSKAPASRDGAARALRRPHPAIALAKLRGGRALRQPWPRSTVAARPRLATALAEVRGGSGQALWRPRPAAASWPRFDATAPHNGALAQFRGGRALAELRVVIALYKPVVVIAELAVEGEKLDAFLFRERQTGTDDCVMSGKGG